MNGSVSYTAIEWLQILLLGGLIGALGQTARTVVGLKKVNDAASSQVMASGNPPVSIAGQTEVSATNHNNHHPTMSDLIMASRLLVSLAIGFVVGAIAGIYYLSANFKAISPDQVFAIAAAGYAGADFIEGFMLRAVGASSAPSGQNVAAVGSGSAGTPSVSSPFATQSNDAAG